MRPVGSMRERSLRVLVAQATDAPDVARLLEADGMRVVGRASTPEEVDRLLRVTRPSVVVFGADMTVDAVASARASHPEVGIVAVWPTGIASETVDRVVAPDAVAAELPAAVRAVAPTPIRRRAAAVVVPAAPQRAEPAGAAPRRGRGGIELGVAAALTLLLVLSAVALREGEDLSRTRAGASSPDPALPTAPPTGSPVTPPEAPSATTTAREAIDVTAEVDPAPPGADTGGATSPEGGSDGPSVGGGTDGSGPGNAGGFPNPGGGGGGGPTPGDGGGGGPTPGGGGTGGGGLTLTARERACRLAADLPLRGSIRAVVHAGGPVGHVLERCLATHAPGPLRALRVLTDRDHGGNGGHGSHGHGHGNGNGNGGGSGGHGNGGGSGGHGNAGGQGHGIGHESHGNGHGYGHESHGHGHGHGHYENDEHG